MVDKIVAGLFMAFVVYLLWRVLVLVSYKPPPPKSYMPRGEYDQAQPFEPTESVEVIIDGKIHPITYTHVTQEKYNDMARNEARFVKDAEKLNGRNK